MQNQKAKYKVHKIINKFLNELNKIIIEELVYPIGNNACYHEDCSNKNLEHLRNDIYNKSDNEYIKDINYVFTNKF